jgi:hypothetical protein
VHNQRRTSTPSQGLCDIGKGNGDVGPALEVVALVRIDSYWALIEKQRCPRWPPYP